MLSLWIGMGFLKIMKINSFVTKAKISTHDNETPNQRRTAEDTLPNAVIVAMSNCAIGSVKGYDEIVPELLNVVTETRKYRVPEPIEGIIPGKIHAILVI